MKLSVLSHHLDSAPPYPKNGYKTQFFQLHKEEDRKKLEILFKESPPIVINEIESQLREYMKCIHPKLALTHKELDQLAVDHLNGLHPDAYGNWVYYPWSNKLVHILDEKEFTKVRTNRNHYKISPEEEEILSTKKVGLIGLSVGQSVALAMAMERGFGELRLADFDELELTNLNRIRTGIHNLGINKSISVAREILEIDPYLNVKCFPEGLTDENMDAFFTKGGKLDLLIDECDGLDIKVLCRFKAKELGIPVVMEASDRGMVDVERYDKEPERPILHGLISDLDPAKLKTLKTNEDKIPYMLAIVGAETISDRAKASMLEIGETITTWPQLASAVALGGGITADVVRRIFLDQFQSSGRYYVDVEDIIGDNQKKESKDLEEEKKLSKTYFEDFGPKIDSNVESNLPDDLVERIAKAACHAPSGGNLQPWRWTYGGGKFQLFNNTSVQSGFLDHNNIASLIALGTSLENAALASLSEGYELNSLLFPIPENESVVAIAECAKVSEVSAEDLFLGRNIYNRETNRNIEKSHTLKETHKELLKSYARKNGSHLILIDDPSDKQELGRLIAAAEQLRIMHPLGHQNFVDEMRWSKAEAEKTRDGIDIATCDLTIGELTGFKLARAKAVIELLDEWNGGAAFKRLSLKSTDSAAALGIISAFEKGPEAMINAGRDMERVWIGANANGISFQPQSPLTLILERLDDSADLNQHQLEILQKSKEKLNHLIQKYGGGHPYFLFRLFYGKKPVVKSLRRELKNQFRIQE